MSHGILKWARIAATLGVAIADGAHAQPGHRTPVFYERAKPPASPPTGRVAELIEAFSNDTLEARRAARQALLAMGPEIRPQLQWALDQEAAAPTIFDLRVAPTAGLRSARPRYAYAELTVLTDHLDQARRSAASTVSLRHTNATLPVILRDFGARIDAKVVVSSYPKYDFDALETWLGTIDVDSVNYWDALRAIQGALAIRPILCTPCSRLGPGIEDVVQFHQATDTVPPTFPLNVQNAVVAGPLLIAPTSVERRQPAGITVTLQAVAEPKVGAGEYAIVEVTEYSDDRGQSLLSRDAERTFTSIMNPAHRSILSEADWLHAWGWTVPVQLPSPAPGRRIGTLKGRFGVAVGPPGLDIVVADLARAVGQSFEWDGVMLSVTSVRADAVAHVVSGEISAPLNSPLSKAMVEYRSTGPAQEFASNHLMRIGGLLDSSRKVIDRGLELGQTRHDAGRTTLAWTLTTVAASPLSDRQLAPAERCDAQCTPHYLLWSTPTLTRWMWVPFELRDMGPGRSAPSLSPARKPPH